MKREREAQHRDSTGLRCRPARNPCAGRATAGDQRDVPQLLLAQRVDHRQPGDIELVSRRRRPPARDPIGLLHQHDAGSRSLRRLCGRVEIGRADASPRTVAKHERADGIGNRAHVNARRAMRCGDFDDRKTYLASREILR
jgi:hypothetical protein